MIKTGIYDFNGFPTNERNGSYGGKAGSKEGICINDENWIIKYPQTTKGMRGDLASYTTAPLSEYIGSHIYEILGIDVHETLLGIRNDKLVVACKDFCKTEGSLREIRTLKNIYNKELEEQLEISLSSTSSSHLIALEDMIIQLNYNPALKEIPDIKDRFWEQFIVDLLINNNDRNNGNWGVLLENGEYKLAPVFDNGASFSTKLPDYKLESYLSSQEKMQNSIEGCTTIYSVNGKVIKGKDFLNIENENYYKTIEKIIPLISDKMNEIKSFIYNIPEKCKGLYVCSNIRKEFYVKSMELRFEKFLIPTFDKIKERSPSKKKDTFGLGK